MPLDAPFRLGPFIVDVHDRLQPGEAGRFPSFCLAWRGCPVKARLDDGGGAHGAGQLALSAVVGRVPSTAGGDAQRNQERRSVTLRALRELTDRTSQTALLRLLPDHRFAMEVLSPVDLPVSAGDLLTRITCFLLEVGPYLDLLGEADFAVESVDAAPSRNGGIANI